MQLWDLVGRFRLTVRKALHCALVVSNRSACACGSSCCAVQPTAALTRRHVLNLWEVTGHYKARGTVREAGPGSGVVRRDAAATPEGYGRGAAARAAAAPQPLSRSRARAAAGALRSPACAGERRAVAYERPRDRSMAYQESVGGAS